MNFLSQNKSRPADDIRISKIINKNSGKGNVLLSVILSFVIVAVTLIGTVFTFTTMFNVKASSSVVLTVCILFALLFTVVCKAPKSIKFVYPAGAVIFAGLAAVFAGDVANGVRLIYADVLSGINDAMFWELPIQQYVWNPSYTASETLVISLLAVLLAALIALFLAYRVSIIGTLLSTFPFFLIGTAFGVVPGHLPAAMLISGWAACLVMRLSGVRPEKRKKAGQFASRRQRHTFSKSASAAVPLGVGVVTIAISLVLLVASSMYLDSNSMRSGNINSLRLTISEQVQRIMKVTFSGTSSNSLSNGDLATLGNRNIKNKPYLNVTVPKFKSGGTQYIKGFVGTIYTGNSWKDASDYQDYSVMFSNFSTGGIFPQNFDGAVLSSIAKTDGNLGASYADVSISVLRGTSNYAYTFYNSLFPSGYQYNYDTTVSSPGSSYSYGVFTKNVTREEYLKSSMLSDSGFNTLREMYSNFVYHEYLLMPASGLDSFKALYQTKKKPADIYSYGEFVHSELEADKHYDLESERMPIGKDFVEFFMFTQKKGYCVHFATAATMMFRAAGIPARYVEGYVLRESDYANATQNADGSYQITLTDAQAHAWVEIWDDDLGWVVYDATPGYYDKADQTDEIGASDTDDDGDDSDETTEEGGKDDEEENLEIDDPESDNTVYIPEGSKEYIAFKDFLKVWCGWAVALSAVFLIGALLAVRRSLAVKSREKAFSQNDKTEVAKAAYRYLTRILFYELIENKENIPYMKYAEIMAESSKHLDKKDTKTAMEIFLKSRFSQTELTDYEAKFIVEFVEKYAKSVYTAATPVGRWIFATVRALY